ncbi:hypothetical protein Sfulv_06670 [Streptomyces fulvorobeus]|uniref:Uncharacterized protein n=1 Tax=Streptomyces fulvorobeus TaxID=284028 RepID=A0A7J0C2A4_9ACTN|nr:hypothetical protein Sfulv_06670 [Streptomyces fulvorobeus]
MPAGAGAGETEGAGSGSASSDSRTGGCTICGAGSWTARTGRAASGQAGRAARGSTDTQPETAVTATPTRSFAVMLVRRTRQLCGCAGPMGSPRAVIGPHG